MSKENFGESEDAPLSRIRSKEKFKVFMDGLESVTKLEIMTRYAESHFDELAKEITLRMDTATKKGKKAMGDWTSTFSNEELTSYLDRISTQLSEKELNILLGHEVNEREVKDQ
ncbi:MAG: hypothetical protein AAB343_03490 [Patescibacteria group bacterium]